MAGFVPGEFRDGVLVVRTWLVGLLFRGGAEEGKQVTQQCLSLTLSMWPVNPFLQPSHLLRGIRQLVSQISCISRSSVWPSLPLYSDHRLKKKGTGREWQRWKYCVFREQRYKQSLLKHRQRFRVSAVFFSSASIQVNYAHCEIYFTMSSRSGPWKCLNHAVMENNPSFGRLDKSNSDE